MAFALIQPSFSAGELSPNILARVDLAKWHVGAFTMRNYFVDYRGGAASRPGTRFIGSSYSSYANSPAALSPVRLVPFQFNITQTYVLEFGTNGLGNYMRIITNGGYILETGVAVSAISQLNPCTITTSAPHGYSNGQWIVPQGIGGMTQINGKTYVVTNVTATTFTLTDLFGNSVDSSAYTAFTSGGTVSRIYTVVSPYAATDLVAIKWTQSANTLTITHNNYPVYNLVRNGQTNWVFSAVSYTSNQNAPVAVSASPTQNTAPTCQISYVVTAIGQNGEESIASNAVVATSVDISQTAGSVTVLWNAVAGALSYNVYRAQIGYSNTTVPVGALYGLIGSTSGLQFIDGNIAPDFTITPPIHQNPFANQSVNIITPATVGTGYANTTTVTVSDPTGTGAVVIPIIVGGQIIGYYVANGGQNYSSPSLVYGSTGGGTGATATLTVGPASGNYPGCCTYFQQRQYFGNTLNNPDTFYATRPGIYNNMDISNPTNADDAITDTISSQQVNGIQFMIPMPNGLVMLTGLGAWLLTGGQTSSAVTPQDADAMPQAYNGCHFHVPPITINYDILYIQARGSIVRDLSYNFFVNVYTGNDLTVLSNHLFLGHQILEWAWAEEPWKVVWCVRDDGIMLSLTYLKDQDVYAWARHDTYGYYESICAVSEFPVINSLPVGVNAVYVVVQRYIQGKWVQYIERQDDRVWTTLEDTWAVDAGLQSPSNYPAANLSASAAAGAGVVFTADQNVFTAANVGNVIRMGQGIATITGYISATQVTGTFTLPILQTIPNDFIKPARPEPAAAGFWSMNPPLTTVSGLDHLNGCIVSILADGSVQTPQMVVNGSITLVGGPTLATIGLGFQAQLATLPTDSGNPTIQGKRGSIVAATVRSANSRGIKVGQISFSKVVEIKERTNAIFAGLPIPLYTGDERIVLNPGISKGKQIYIQQDYPLPSNVLGVIPEITVGDSNG
jgi:hypothetical protein